MGNSKVGHLLVAGGALFLLTTALAPAYGQTYAQQVVASGLAGPEGVAVDASGNVYVGVASGNEVLKETYSPSTGLYTQSLIANYAESTLVTGAIDPVSVAVDSEGNVYSAFRTTSGDEGGVFEQVPVSGGYSQEVAVFLSSVPAYNSYYVISVATEPGIDSKLYLTWVGYNSVKGSTFGCGYSTDGNTCVFQYGLFFNRGNPPTGYWDETYVLEDSCIYNVCQFLGVASDASGNVYLTDQVQGQVISMSPATASNPPQTVIATISNAYLWGIAVDPSGNLYVVDSKNALIYKETLSGGAYTQSVLPIDGLKSPTGIAVDANGFIYIADTGNGRVVLERPRRI